MAAGGFEILTEIACTINSVLDLDQLYRVIYEQGARIFATPDFWIGLCPNEKLDSPVTWLVNGAEAAGAGPVDPRLSSQVLSTRSTLRAAHEDAGTWIGVPMLIGERPIGIIAASRPEPFTPDDERMLEAIAALCAIAIENAGLVQTVSETAQLLVRRSKELYELNIVARAVNTTLDLATMLAKGADALLRATGWETATVCLRGTGDSWNMAMHRRVATAGEMRAGETGTFPNIGHPDDRLYPYVSEVLTTGRPVMAALDLERSETYSRFLATGRHRLVVFPLRAGPGGKWTEPPVLGLLLLSSRIDGAGRANLAEMLGDTTLMAIGEQLATAIQNARLLNAVQTARSRLAAVLDSTADGVIFYTNDLHIELANRAAREMYGLPQGAMLGKGPSEVAALIAGSFAEPSQAHTLMRRLETEAPDVTYTDECLIGTARARPRVIQRSVYPVRDSGGAILGRLVVHHDVTEAKALEGRTRELAMLEERQRLARELHDSVTQSLFTITLMAEATQAIAGRDPEKAVQYLDRLKSTAGTALDEMRALLAQLRPATLGTSGLEAALRKHTETLAQQLGLTISVRVDPTIGALPEEVEDALYRIAQEALHNVVKHASAQHAAVSLARALPSATRGQSDLLLTIEDDGCGFDPAHVSPDKEHGFGLTGMGERAAAIGGQLSISSTLGGGSHVTVTLPLGS